MKYWEEIAGWIERFISLIDRRKVFCSIISFPVISAIAIILICGRLGEVSVSGFALGFALAMAVLFFLHGVLSLIKEALLRRSIRRGVARAKGKSEDFHPTFLAKGSLDDMDDDEINRRFRRSK
ncbi:MAG: hypothetical protein HYT03_01355 [Candidatus Harrisonbacteria bacterium]|nr:hypothetical protein [Candidatus Harrisonbacteria bacterium]